ncbi:MULTISPECIES: efflux RND transporter permease subunit [Halocynthiibacter]|uniref:Efflux RND transporter permease subunit n=1 Tax=Halocynthiibacter halioticoli TaxID=2986804 RepID=A0AAE3IWV9_9RHOB|nr:MULTISPECIES: efflux RND transporter permease subunit [Halocynthiibacter]MCV6823204.1 efflux RND transporter permease subunit [Halocynthiibacter halioticoli]MCW4056205.1 efflux RND transporter permease subunit [Halocynthiibacter sp. SDUM655004]
MRNTNKMAGGILSYFTRHATAANLLLVVLIVAGLAAVPNMRAQFFPDVVIDSVSVSVDWEGAGAEDVDTAIVQLLEPALLGVEGVESSYSTSREGSAQISLDFEDGWDMSRAADEVQAAVDSVSNLPEDAEDPNVRRGAWRDRVTDVVIEGPVDVEQLGRLADEFVTRLFSVGVTRTTLRGFAAPETIVEVPSTSLIKNDVSMQAIATAIAAEVDADPAGDVEGANARVRTGVAKRSAEEIADIILRSEPDGTQLRIGDVASVTQQGIDSDRAYFVGENPAISIRIDRSASGDAIAIQQQVEDVAEEMRISLPKDVNITLIRTRAEAITGRLALLLDNGLMGLGLVVMLLFLFLNARIALWVAAGIPVAMLAAISLMYAAGLTFNMISLFALIITLGIVVDDAIVVGEHADFRARRLGESPLVAAENAAIRMAPPVFSATVTTVIAFFGLVAIGGRFGSLIADIPFTVIVVLIASLVECFLILPNHMAHALRHAGKNNWYDWPNRVVNRGFSWFRDNIFRRFMRLVVVARYPVIAMTVVLLSIQAAHFINGDVQWRFFNAPEQSSVSGNFAMVNGATREDTFAMMQEMQRAATDLGARYEEEYGTNPIVYTLAEIGGNTGRGLSGVDTKDSDLLGSIAIELIDSDYRPYSAFAFVAALQEEVRQHPLAEVVSFRGWRSGPGGDSLDVQFYGAEAPTLKATAEALKTALTQFPEVSAVEDSLSYDKEEMILELTPQGQAMGFSIDTLGRVLRDRLNGIEAATYPDGPRSAKIRVELPEGELSADFLERSYMRSETGDYLKLADIVRVDQQSGFSTVRRENGIRVVSVTGDISEDDPDRASAIMTQLEEEILPELESEFGVGWRLAGLAEQEQEFLTDALVGFVMCLTGIYLTLAWVFSSWTRPIVVMAIIPFGLVGTIYGHLVWEVPLSMFSVVGLIGMTGIIINDSIVLITTIDEYAEERGLFPAIIDGVADRLRPVMLTTLTTVLGLAPLLFESSSQAQFLKPTVVTLVYGLGFGMVLVLLVVPSLIAIQSDFSGRIASARRAFRFPEGGRLVSFVSTAVALFALLAFAVTMGVSIVTGEFAGVLLALMPGLANAPLIATSFALFVGLTLLATLIGFFIGAVLFGRSEPRSVQDSPTQP